MRADLSRPGSAMNFESQACLIWWRRRKHYFLSSSQGRSIGPTRKGPESQSAGGSGVRVPVGARQARPRPRGAFITRWPHAHSHLRLARAWYSIVMILAVFLRAEQGAATRRPGFASSARAVSPKHHAYHQRLRWDSRMMHSPRTPRPPGASSHPAPPSWRKGSYCWAPMGAGVGVHAVTSGTFRRILSSTIRYLSTSILWRLRFSRKAIPMSMLGCDEGREQRGGSRRWAGAAKGYALIA